MKRILLIALAAFMTLSAAADGHHHHETTTQTQKKTKKTKEVRTVAFSVSLHCASCVKKINENIAFEKGVKGLDACLGHQTVTIQYDPAKTSEETLKAALVKLGFEVKGTVDPAEAEHHSH